MSWIQENKFTAALAGVTVVGSAVLFGLSVQKSGDTEAFLEDASKMLAKERKLQQGVPYPNKENMDLKQENVRDFHDATVELQKQLVAYRPEEMKDFSTTQFGPKLSEYREALDAAFKESKAAVPEGTYYGFEKYAARQPIEKATGELSYQLDAFKWLLGQLAETGAIELIKVVRSDIAAEEPTPSDSRDRDDDKDESVGEGQGLEVAFRGTEAQVEQFLESVANSKQYFFAIRSIRVRNEKQVPPTELDARFPTQPEASVGGGFGVLDAVDSGGGLFAEGGEGETVAEGGDVPEDGPSTDDTLVLKSILGDEKVNVYLQMELLIFKPEGEVKIPGKGSKQGGSAAETDSDESETE